MNEIDINIRHFLIVALGTNDYLHPLIEELYKKREWEYYEAYRNSEFYGDVLIGTHTTKSEEKMRQVAGIVQWCYEHNQMDSINQLMKKGYKYAVQYVQQRTRISIEDFAQSYTKRQGGLDKVTDLDLFNHNIVLTYLCYREKKPVNTQNIAGRLFTQGLQDTIKQCFFEEMIFSEAKIENRRKEIDALYDHYQLPKKITSMSISALFERTIDQRFSEKMEKNPFQDPHVARQQIFKEPYTKHIGALSGWVKTLRLSEMDATEQVILTKRDIDIVFMEWLIAKKENNLQESDQDLFIASTFYIKTLIVLYQETKRLYLDSSVQDYYVNMKAKEEQILTQEKELKQQQQASEKALEEKQQEMNGMEQEIRELKARIREQQQQLNEREEYEKEVHALRTYLYQLQEISSQVQTKKPSLEEMAEAVQSKRIWVFGGHPNWRQKLKEWLPKVEFIEVEEKNRDYSMIQRADAVFINTSVFNHAFYQKIMKDISKGGTKLFYFSGNSNVEKNVQDMYESLFC